MKRLSSLTSGFWIAAALLLGFSGIAYAEFNEEQMQQLLAEIRAGTASGDTDAIRRGLDRNGVFGCTGAGFGSIGKIIGSGAFVPTNDEATIANTQISIYKECVLDGVVISLREAALGLVTEATGRFAAVGQDGAPTFVTDLREFLNTRVKDVASEIILGQPTERLSPVVRNQVRLAVARSERSKQDKTSRLECPLSEQQLRNHFSNIGTFSFEIHRIISENPQCTQVGAQRILTEIIETEQDIESFRETEKLRQGSGFLTYRQCEEIQLAGGRTAQRCENVTPGSTIGGIIGQVLGGGQRQSEAADEIDEIIGAAFAQLGTETLYGARGLIGLSENQGGQPSYLSRITDSARDRARGLSNNAGLSTLNTSLATENQYKTAKESAITHLDRARSQLATRENQCWDGIVNRAAADLGGQVRGQACAAEPERTTTNSNGDEVVQECTVRASVQVTESNGVYRITATANGGGSTFSEEVIIAASTVESDRAIDRNVQPIDVLLRSHIRTAEQVITILEALVDRLNTSGTDATSRFVLERLDALVAARAIHNEVDVRSAQEQAADIDSAMRVFVEDTAEAWDNGWCDPASWRDHVRTAGDSTDPDAPNLVDESDTGSSDTDNLTNDITPSFSGACTSGDTVTLTVGTSTATAQCTGLEYTATFSDGFVDGEYDVSATFTNPSGQTTAASPTLTFTIDTTPPAAPAVTSPLGGATLSDTTPNFVGTTEASAIIDGLGPGARSCTTNTGTDGLWSCTFSTPLTTNGDKDYTFASTDTAGNTSASTPITITIQTQ